MRGGAGAGGDRGGGGCVVYGEGVEELVARHQRLLEAPLAAVQLRQPRPRLPPHPPTPPPPPKQAPLSASLCNRGRRAVAP